MVDGVRELEESPGDSMENGKHRSKLGRPRMQSVERGGRLGLGRKVRFFIYITVLMVDEVRGRQVLKTEGIHTHAKH